MSVSVILIYHYVHELSKWNRQNHNGNRNRQQHHEHQHPEELYRYLLLSHFSDENKKHVSNAISPVKTLLSFASVISVLQSAGCRSLIEAPLWYDSLNRWYIRPLFMDPWCNNRPTKLDAMRVFQNKRQINEASVYIIC